MGRGSAVATFAGSARRPWLSAAVLAVALAGCGDESDRCPPDSTVIEAEDDASVAEAIGEAGAGTCIALAAGSYGPIALPGGASLVGEGPGAVTIEALGVAAGDGTLVRDLAVGAGGLRLEGARAARIQGVHIRDSVGDGLTLAGGASATVVDSEIHTAGGRGVSAVDAGALTIERTVITGSLGAGLWAQCGTGCDCPSIPSIALHDVALTQNASIGLALVGVRSEMNGVAVRNTVPSSFKGGGGIAAWGCATVTASKLELTDNASYGMLVDGAAAELTGVEIAGNLQGLWIKSSSPAAGTGVSVSDLTLTGNRAVGLGLGGDVVGFIVDGSRILQTLAETMQVKKGGEFGDSESLGDAISWQAGAQATLEDVTIGGSARVALLIDGAVGAGSRLSRITLEGGDETKPFLQQNLPEGGTTPELGESVPALEQFATEQLAVPVAPTTPAGP